MEGFCRGCLIKYDDPEELLEYTEKNRRLFIYCTGLQVKRNDTFSFQLCKDCYLNMKQSCKFKKLCRTSDKKFKTYLSLKEAGETADLCTYLKNNDDNFTLRFPTWAGSSTPANQKRDDDNESTCTSIGNFMRDILQGTEMPDSEARIIRQVIEEEADVLDDSLDSHWLQDDASIDTNFQLDLSFSPFSTPRSVNNDHCYTPRRQGYQETEENRFGLPKQMLENPLLENNKNDDIDDEKPIEVKEYDVLSDSFLDNIGQDFDDHYVKTENVFDDQEIEKIENDIIIEQSVLNNDQVNKVNSKNYYVDTAILEQTVNEVASIFEAQGMLENGSSDTFDGKGKGNDKGEGEQINVTEVFDGKGGKGKLANVDSDFASKDVRNQNADGIDKRLEEALKDNNEMVTLEDLLGSPTAYPNSAAPSTPTIENILFGSPNLSRIGDEANQKVGQTIEKFDNVQSDMEILDKLLLDAVKTEPATPPFSPQPDPGIEAAISETIKVSDNLSVNLSYTLPENVSKKRKPKKKKKAKPDDDHDDNDDDDDIKVVDCLCTMCNKKFTSLRTLKIHSARVHKNRLPKAKKKHPPKKLLICDHCGKQDMDKRNFTRHVKTHMPKSVKCELCGLIFPSKAKYNVHRKGHVGAIIKSTGQKQCCDICGREVLRSSMYKHRRIHLKEYKYPCHECGKGYHTPRELREHMLEHTGERPHECEVCKLRFMRRNALIRHMRAHMGEKRYACENCNKRYANKVTLIDHIKSRRCSDFKETGKMNRIKRKPVATNTIKVIRVLSEEELARKPFECVYCHSRHKTENYLIRHQMTRACKEIQFREIAPTIIEILYEKGDATTKEKGDLSQLTEDLTTLKKKLN